MSGYSRVTRRKHRMGGAPCVRGTRLTTRCLYGWYKAGHPIEFIMKQYPTTARQDILAAVAFEQGRIHERRRYRAQLRTAMQKSMAKLGIRLDRLERKP